MNRSTQRRTKSSGNVLIEFALGSSVLLALFAGTYQFGFAFLLYNNLNNAVVRAARYAAVTPYDSPNATPSDTFLASVRNVAVYGSPTGGTTPALPNLATSNISLTVEFNNGVPYSVTEFVTNYTINAVFRQFTLQGRPMAKYSYLGIWSPV